jgi:hypothetical protein
MISAMLRFLLALLLVSLSVLASDLPPVPADGLRDDARFFTKEGAAQLRAEVQALEQATGIRGYVDANTYIEGGQRGTERAQQLVQSWGQGRSAVVICLDRSAPRPGALDVSADLWERFTEPELMALIAKTVLAMGDGRTDETAVLKAVREMREGFTEQHAAATARARVLGGHDVGMLIAFLLVLGLGAALTMWLVRRNQAREAEADVRHYFPDVEVAPRLGAPNGGGVMAAVQYRR